MPNGGTLRLVCRAASRNRVEIDIEDTGVGIAPENLQKIFDLYFTTKEKGSGIGLSMVYRTVQLHDGAVEAPPRSAIWPADCIGGPPRRPVRPSSPLRAR